MTRIATMSTTMSVTSLSVHAQPYGKSMPNQIRKSHV